MTIKLRAAVVGCGAISERLHVPDYATCPDAEIVGLCDKDASRAKALAAKWAPEAAIYTDYKKMLAEVSADCVTVTLPNVLHCPVTIDCLKAGAHVMVEKPMATSLAEARKMCDAAKKAGKLLLVNQTQRLINAHKKAREVIQSGVLGKVLHVNGVFGHSGPDNWAPGADWFFNKKSARFGAMADLGIHKADLIRYLAGKEIAEISAYSARLDKKGTVEDNFVSSFKFDDGTVGMLSASWTFYGKGDNYIIFHCEKGSLHVNWDPAHPCIGHLEHPEGRIFFDPPPPIEKYPESWGVDVSGHFVAACKGEMEPFCTGEEGMKSLQVILAAEKSAATGKSVKV